MNNELFRRDVDCQRVGNLGSSDCSGDLLFRSLAAQKSSVFRKVLRAESGRGGYVGCTGTFLPGIFPFHESQL